MASCSRIACAVGLLANTSSKPTAQPLRELRDDVGLQFASGGGNRCLVAFFGHRATVSTGGRASKSRQQSGGIPCLDGRRTRGSQAARVSLPLVRWWMAVQAALVVTVTSVVASVLKWIAPAADRRITPLALIRSESSRPKRLV